MRVRIDEARENHFPRHVDALYILTGDLKEDVFRFPDRRDAVLFNQHRPVFDAFIVAVHRDDISVNQNLSPGHASLL